MACFQPIGISTLQCYSRIKGDWTCSWVHVNTHGSSLAECPRHMALTPGSNLLQSVQVGRLHCIPPNWFVLCCRLFCFSFLLLWNDTRHDSHYFAATRVFADQFSRQTSSRDETLWWAKVRLVGHQRMQNSTPEHFGSCPSPDLAVSAALTFWLHADNLRPQVRRHPCDLILDDKLVYVFVAKRKLELWKHWSRPNATATAASGNWNPCSASLTTVYHFPFLFYFTGIGLLPK